MKLNSPSLSSQFSRKCSSLGREATIPLRSKVVGWLAASIVCIGFLHGGSVNAQIYITESGSSSVSQFTMEGAPAGSNPLIPGSAGINGPTGIAVDQAGNVYVASYWANSVGFYEASTGNFNATLITGLNGPYGVAVDNAGNVYVADNGNASIGKYTPGSGYNASFITSIAGVTSLALDAEGNLYFGSGSTNFIGKYDTMGTLKTDFINSPNGAVGMAIHGDALYTIGNGVVGKFSTEDGSGTASYITGLDGSYGIATDLQGNLYVASHANGTITMYDGNGTGGQTPLISGLANPYYIAVAIPEPSGVALLGIGLTAAAMMAFKAATARP